MKKLKLLITIFKKKKEIIKTETLKEKKEQIEAKATEYSNNWDSIRDTFIIGAISKKSFEYWRDHPNMVKHYKNKNYE